MLRLWCYKMLTEIMVPDANTLNLVCSKEKNMVARIYITVCFWHQRVKTPHVLSFFKSAISSRAGEKFAEVFFHLASARYVSLGHVVAIDPLIDSIPESSIDCWASAVLHLTGAFFLRCCQQRSIYWVPATSFLPRTRTFRVHSLRMWTTDFTTMLLVTFHQRSIN